MLNISVDAFLQTIFTIAYFFLIACKLLFTGFTVTIDYLKT